MAISHRASGSWAYAASGSVTPTLATHQAGDMLLVRVAYKSSNIAACAASTATSGWAKVGEKVGTGNSGNGTGGVTVAAFWKQAASSSDTAPTIDFSQTVTQVGHVAITYQKAAGESWVTPTGDGGEETTVGTSFSQAIATHVSVTAGDMVDMFFGIRDDCTVTVPTFTQTGVTYAAVSEQPATAGTDTGGADGAYDGCYRLATSGTSSAAAVATCTLNTTETGTAWMTRLRVEVATTADAGIATGTGEAFNITTSVTAQAGAATGTGAALNAIAGVGGSAGNAAGTGEAFGGSTAIVSGAGNASATGTAGAPTPAITVSAGNASGTGEAFNATFDVGTPAVYADAGVASGTGTAFGGSSSIVSSSGSASATGAANAPSPSITSSAGSAAATGDALGVSSSITSSAGTASATGSAGAPSPSLTASAGHAGASGQAFNATFDAGNAVFVDAGVATGTGTAFGASVAIEATSGNAVGSGEAFNATFDVAAAPGEGGSHGKRRPVRTIVMPPTPVEVTFNVVTPPPRSVLRAEVNDDEVVLELLARVL